MKPRKVAVLINAASGSVAGKEDAIRKELESGFAAHAISADLQFLAGDALKSAAEAARSKALAGELDAIVVSGGDGTIRTVVEAVADTDVPLGVIPGGTFNHFAKDLGIPLPVTEAIAVIASGNLGYIDAGEVNGKIFINNSSIGIYPYLVVTRERRRKNGVPKMLAMIWAMLRAVRNFPIRRLSIKAEGSTESLRSPCVFVGNNEYAISGRQVGTRSRIDGGKISLLMAKHQSLPRLLLLGLQAVFGMLNQSSDLRTMALSSLEVSSRRRRLLVALDGEVELMTVPLRYRIKPRAIRVFVPTDPRQARR